MRRKRHLVLSAVSYLFLARIRQECGGEKPGADGVPGAYGDRGVDSQLVAGPTPLGEAGGTDGGRDPQDAAEDRGGAQEPQQTSPHPAPRRPAATPLTPTSTTTRSSSSRAATTCPPSRRSPACRKPTTWKSSSTA